MSFLSVGRARELLDYDHATGEFRWRVRRGRQAAGAIAGTPHNHGYWGIRMLGQSHLAHRLAWFMHYGEWPSDQLDHINGDKRDNRIANLRVVTNRQNNENYRSAKHNSKTGYLGVCYEPRGGSYVAYLRVEGRTRNLGTYRTPKEAHEAYVAAKRVHHEGCTL